MAAIFSSSRRYLSARTASLSLKAASLRSLLLSSWSALALSLIGSFIEMSMSPMSIIIGISSKNSFCEGGLKSLAVYEVGRNEAEGTGSLGREDRVKKLLALLTTVEG